MNEYKAIVTKYPRGGDGVDVHCHDVGLEDPSTVAGDALAGWGSAPKEDDKKSAETAPKEDDKRSAEPATTYEEWIKAE